MMRRSMVMGAINLLAVGSLSALALGCSSTKPSEPTTSPANSVDPAASVDSVASASQGETSGDGTKSAGQSASASTVLKPSIAVGEPNPATPTDSSGDPSADSLAAANTEAGAKTAATPEASLIAGPTELTKEQLTSAFNAMGIPVSPDSLSCVKEKAGKTDMSAPEPPPEFLRALMSCVPKSLAEANGDKLSASATKSGVTVEKAKCFQEKTFETMAATDIEAFTKLLDANAPVDFPADMKATLRENTKPCVLTDAQFSSLLEG
jgi:hypothetical protein